jgi:integrase
MERTKQPGIFRRGKSYVGIVTYRDGFGRKRQKWLPPEATLAQAKSARRMMLNDLDKGLRPDGSRMTVEDFALKRFLPDAETRLRPISIRNYRSLTVHVLPALGQLKVREVDRQHLRGLYGTLTPATAARVHSVLSAMFNFGVRDEAVLAVNPCATVRRPRYRPAEARHLDPEQARRMLDAVLGDPLEGAIILGLAGGLRIGEAVAVRWGDLEEDGTLTVRRSWWGETKSGKIRSLTLPASAHGALKRFKTRQAEQLLAIGVRQGTDTTVCADPIGRPMALSTLKDAFGAFVKMNGFDVSFHGLRHSNAIAMLVAGVDPKTAASRLGHSNPALLFKTYSHYIRSADKTAAERLEGMLGG